MAEWRWPSKNAFEEDVSEGSDLVDPADCLSCRFAEDSGTWSLTDPSSRSLEIGMA